ncbi:MAG: hypothetical protein V1820_03845 [archaeon]
MARAALKELVCDSSSIIALAEVCLLELFSEFTKSGVKFYIPIGVRKEVIDTPISTKSFRLEAVRISSLAERGDLSVIDKEEIAGKAREIGGRVMALANGIFHAEGRPIHLIDYGEADAIGLALAIGCGTILVDEKTTRLLIEAPLTLHESLEMRTGKKIGISKENLSELSAALSSLSAIRSAELVAVGFTNGALKKVCCNERGHDLLFGALIAVKENGCSISEAEIGEYVELLAPRGGG